MPAYIKNRNHYPAATNVVYSLHSSHFIFPQYWIPIRHFIGKPILISIGSIALLLLSFSSFAANYGAQVKSAALATHHEHYVLDANIPILLSPIAKDALQNSISLTWELQIKLEKKREFLWNKNLYSARHRYKIRYHPLLNMYQVKIGYNGRIVSFSTLRAALNAIESVQGLKLAALTEIQENTNLVGKLKMAFIKERLPLPLRPLSYFNPGWYLSSEWFKWHVHK